MTFTIDRRRFLAGSSAVAGFAALPSMARAQAYPDKTLQVVIPTGEGGGLDQAARAFTRVWSKHLGANFEFSYYPGASGQVGYEVYLGRREPDAYNLLFGNIGPEMIMYKTQPVKFKYPDDFIYFGSIDTDDSVIWVAKTSKFKTLQDMIEEGQKREITLSTSRLPHPSTLGVLALSEATGMKVRMIPYGGGGPARSAAITGEVDGCATFLSTSLGLNDQIDFLTVFNVSNRAPEMTNDAPPVNSVIGKELPVMTGLRAWAIHRKAVDEFPDRLEKLSQTLRQTIEDPEYIEVAEKSGTPRQFIEFQDAAACERNARETMELAERFRDQLSASR